MKKQTNIIDFKSQRIKRRKRYLARHGDQLENFIAEFIEIHMPFDFKDLTQLYMQLVQNDELPFEPDLELRDVISSVINKYLGEELFAALLKNSWFDKNFVCREEVIDRSTSYFILRTGAVANS